ncbi:MAG TPA: MerR family transcriptional regulator [Mycobacteriales bacterium]|nr:MerR family transcriptional regulator [Mycobacteriales bacterium]
MRTSERSSASSPTQQLLSIGELSERTGVPATALRYYDELGLVRPASRAAGRRRYASSAVADVRVVLFLREVGFSLAEIGRFTTAQGSSQRALIEQKLAELTQQRHRIEVALAALEHGLRCPAGEPTKCPRFWSILDGRQRGLSLAESHAEAHL